jgi:hypothetical protein
MASQLIKSVLTAPVQRLHRDYNELLGIDNTIRLSKAVNRLIFGAQQRRYVRAYLEHFDELLAENGPLDAALPRNIIRDGWALDTSRSLPHLDRLLEDTAPLLAERGGKSREEALRAKKPYFTSLMEQGDLQRYPSFLDFALSSEVLATVAHHMGCIPVLTRTGPPGVRFMESNEAYNPNPDGPFVESQIFHLDVHDRPVVYVIVLLRDTTEASGPWHFLPASASDRAARRLDYQKRGQPYRVTDERMYGVVNPDEVIRFTGPAGSVLFIESGRCFHYGSRKAIVPRYQMMYGFTTLCRGDLTELIIDGQTLPASDTDSRLRKMVLRHL